MPQTNRIERERDFWDHAIPTVEEALAQYYAGPEPNTRLMLETIIPRPGMKVLDFACGAGVTSAWLASKGVGVTGVELSPASLRVARQVALELNFDIEFLEADIEKATLPDGRFDGLVGRYALHHLDVAKVAPVLARCLAPTGRGAFLETMAINPILRFARSHIVGRAGVPRLGTTDEHPLTRNDVAALGQAFGSVALVQAEFRFLTLADRQLLMGRSPRLTLALRSFDERLARMPGLKDWSYHQVVVVERRNPERDDPRPLGERAVDVPEAFPREREAHAFRWS